MTLNNNVTFNMHITKMENVTFISLLGFVCGCIWLVMKIIFVLYCHIVPQNFFRKPIGKVKQLAFQSEIEVTLENSEFN